VTEAWGAGPVDPRTTSFAGNAMRAGSVARPAIMPTTSRTAYCAMASNGWCIVVSFGNTQLAVGMSS
jgi:hypothetical protein